LSRKGSKKNAFYRIVVADSKSPRDGRFIESIGYYNPMTEPSEIVINEERAVSWMKMGALPTNSVKRLFDLKKIGI
jgi:small subunit ribosomal protein S16